MPLTRSVVLTPEKKQVVHHYTVNQQPNPSSSITSTFEKMTDASQYSVVSQTQSVPNGFVQYVGNPRRLNASPNAKVEHVRYVSPHPPPTVTTTRQETKLATPTSNQAQGFGELNSVIHVNERPHVEYIRYLKVDPLNNNTLQQGTGGKITYQMIREPNQHSESTLQSNI